ncbi:MAG: hypothetical protein K6T65_07295 [Peptococcaceae bacterium]|nr:hypothetical protein [Peptococcaceae bacterium]
MAISSQSEFKAILEKIWLSAHALEASQELQEGILLEQFYENQYVVSARKTADSWDIQEGPASRARIMRIFYYGDGCDKLAAAGDLQAFGQSVQDVIAERKMVFIPLRPPEKLIEAGFSRFGERLGLPGK